ncbi:MAG: GspH/FimT family pseudopilin [Tissierellaceae bacterium]|nr:GspH/FimT family pseudopilin [Tissierellaceae bacterium]
MDTDKYGYTLIELMVVIALIAVILSISLPGIESIFISMEKRELMELKRDLVYARNSAIVENVNYGFIVNKGKNIYSITRQEKVSKIIKKVELKNGIEIVGNNFGSSLTFTPSGAPAGGGTLDLINKKGQSIEITITPATGKVNLYVDRR